MRSLLRGIGAGLVSVAAALPVYSADHREAPAVDQLPPADLNDIYVFRALGAPSRLVLVMTVNPISDPDFNGSYFFSPDVLYRFEIDNDGDAVADRRIDFTFSPFVGGPQTVTARFSPGGGTIQGPTTPANVSPTPSDPAIIRPSGTNIRLFAGQRDDPFFFDAVGFNRFVGGDPDGFRGINSFAGFNVSAIVLEIPIGRISDGATELQISGVTIARTQDGRLGRVIDRTGNPAVATALIPFPQRDLFNRTPPRNQAARWGDVIVDSLEAFGTPQENIDVLASVAVPDTMKVNLNEDIGFPNGRALEDDVIDTLLQLILADPGATDGVDSDDTEFLTEFPYLAPPQQPE